MKKGYRQSDEHVTARIVSGERHPRWEGDAVSQKGGRARALRRFPPGPCETCGSAEGERHHVDGDTVNNASANVRMLCRRCHMLEDGRLERFRGMAKARSADAVAAAAAEKRARTSCKRGHSLSGENLYLAPDGTRVCKTCRHAHKRAHRARRGS